MELQKGDVQPGQDQARPDATVRLYVGVDLDLAPLGLEELRRLQWEQERRFAKRIVEAPRGSDEREAAIRDGYTTVSEILYRVKQHEGAAEPGSEYSPRNADLVLKVLSRLGRRVSGQVNFFEIGFGWGYALTLVDGEGGRVAGLEVAATLVEKARGRLPESVAERLIQGDFGTVDLSRFENSMDFVYWNDVFEHIPPDEIGHYVSRIVDLLRPGGVLVTVTPNWHVRPTDVTSRFRPARSEAEGFHLKEYTLREVCGVMKKAGFRSVKMPLLVTRRRTVLFGGGLIGPKRVVEPLLEFLPMKATRIVTGGLGYHCTIAEK